MPGLRLLDYQPAGSEWPAKSGCQLPPMSLRAKVDEASLPAAAFFRPRRLIRSASHSPEAYAHLPKLVAAVESALHGKDSAFSLSDGIRHFEFLVNSRRNGDVVEGVLRAIIEVTEQRRAAEARAESEQKSWFLATVSPSFALPLTQSSVSPNFFRRKRLDHSTTDNTATPATFNRLGHTSFHLSMTCST